MATDQRLEHILKKNDKVIVGYEGYSYHGVIKKSQTTGIDNPPIDDNGVGSWIRTHYRIYFPDGIPYKGCIHNFMFWPVEGIE